MTTGVVIGCYNHERYLEECIDSVLGQTLRPDRVIVVDDSSDDGSRSIVESYRDAGVELITCDRLGPSVVFNTGVEAIGTDVVAIISADDACLPERLDRQVWLLDRYDVDLIMGLPIVVDDDGEVRSDGLAREFFDPYDSGRGPLLRQLFDSGNFLCAGTATFRRSIYLSMGGFHPGLLQLQDFHLWVRWSWRRMLLTDERFIHYRKSAGSLSSPTNDRRMQLERLWVYRHLFDEIPDVVVQEVFADLLPPRTGDRHRQLDLALVYFRHADQLVSQIGCELLLDVLSDPRGRDALRGYGMNMQDVFARTAATDVCRAAAIDTLIDELVSTRLTQPPA